MPVPRRGLLSALTALILAALACAVPGMPASSLPTLPPGGINTIVALTAGAAQMQTAAALPPASLTPAPTFTPTVTIIPPTETPTPTETVIFHFFVPTSTKPPTTTAASGGGTTAEYACKVIAQNPANNTKLAPTTAFNVSWKVKNTGNRALDKASTDFVFKGGINMAAINGYDFPGDVPPGGTILLTVSMTAPAAAGSYTSTWAVRRGKVEVCTMFIKIIVQ